MGGAGCCWSFDRPKAGARARHVRRDPAPGRSAGSYEGSGGGRAPDPLGLAGGSHKQDQLFQSTAGYKDVLVDTYIDIYCT